MSQLFALKGDVSKELISFNGKVLVHESKEEMKYLFPFGATVVSCPDYIKPEEMLSIRNHPDMAAVRWPLDKKDFRS